MRNRSDGDECNSQESQSDMQSFCDIAPILQPPALHTNPQAALSDTSKRLQESEIQCSRAVSHVQDLEAELAAAQQQGSASVDAWEQERLALQERLARLQKVNQTRRQEMDELQAKLVVAHNAASNTSSVCCWHLCVFVAMRSNL